MEDNIFIWTEIFNCGKIGKICLDSFRLYHPDVKIAVYGLPSDFKWLTPNENNILIDFSQHTNIINRFKEGHYGTASLWSHILKFTEEKYTFFIHFDSDVIFRRECLNDLISAHKEGVDLVGPIRNYKHNPNNREDVRHLPDVTQTLFFGFNRNKINTYRDYEMLTRMCQGALNPLGHPVIDFFDPVMFEILKNNGKIKILDKKDYGGCDIYGKRDFEQKNKHIDFGEKLIHFSAVGSGMNFFNNKTSVGGYTTYAIEKYALFCELFYNEIIQFNYDKTKYKDLYEVKDWYGCKK